jgi:hypothetical protein
MSWERHGWTPEGYPPTWHYGVLVGLLLAFITGVAVFA